MIKNYSNCKQCLHKEVCQYKMQFEETFEKIKTRWYNIAPSNFFQLALECKQYKQDCSVKYGEIMV